MFGSKHSLVECDLCTPQFTSLRERQPGGKTRQIFQDIEATVKSNSFEGSGVLTCQSTATERVIPNARDGIADGSVLAREHASDMLDAARGEWRLFLILLTRSAMITVF